MDSVRLDLLTKIEDQRLRRVVIARTSGNRFKDIAESEGISIERARQLWGNAKRLLDLLARTPAKLTADSPIEDTLTSARFKNVCRAAEVYRIVDLAALTRREFLSNKNCSGKTLREAERLLAQADMEFFNDTPVTGGE